MKSNGCLSRIGLTTHNRPQWFVSSMKKEFSNALQIIRFGPMKKDTLKPESSRRSTRLKVCPVCQKEFVPSSGGEEGRRQVHCSRACQKKAVRKTVTKHCEQCGAEFTF